MPTPVDAGSQDRYVMIMGMFGRLQSNISLIRTFEFSASLLGIILALPVLFVISAAIWFCDFGPPLYVAVRIGQGGRKFKMLKLRSMRVDGDDPAGGNFTKADDPRITPVGRCLRAAKLDELPQLWNVLRGDMSLVGPRPLPEPEVNGYTEEEARRLLSVRPGMTDLASLIFADESEILRGRPDAPRLYEMTIRPWKNQLALLHLENRSLRVDLKIILLSVAGVVSRQIALNGAESILRHWGAGEALARVTKREGRLPVFSLPAEVVGAAVERTI
jgi:lipopolysaccharide/colanic/teichoic acid biosynthesis glycosyltransferase